MLSISSSCATMPVVGSITPVLPRWANTLCASWRSESSILQRRGAEAQASVLADCADELETTYRLHQMEALTLTEAVEETGLTYSTLEKRVRFGKVPNAGSKGAPRILRGHLTGSLPSMTSLGGPDLVARVLY